MINFYKKTLIYNFDPSNTLVAFPTYRTWHKVSDDMKVIKQKKLGAAVQLNNMASHVGYAAAVEVTGAMEIFDKLPSMDLILKDPKKAPVPDDPATLYAICGAVAQKASDQNIANVVTSLLSLGI